MIKLDLTVSAINVNSMNVSTMSNRNAKTHLKIEGITGKKTDIILLSDIRAGNKGTELIKLMGLTRNGSYMLYLNSTKESRGVGIAIKRNIAHEIKTRYDGRGDENVLLLDMVLKGKRLTVGSIYGPNGNDVGFFRDIERVITRWNNVCILGGDFNSVLCDRIDDENLDKEGRGRIPNRQNSRFINEWIENGMLLDPFRTLYPEAKEMSYIPFRTRQIGNRDASVVGKSRLDFFLLSPLLLDGVDVIRYEDRLGSDFDHREVTLKLGRKRHGMRISIFDSTLNDAMAEDSVYATVYENLLNNLVVRDRAARDNVTQLYILMNEKKASQEEQLVNDSIDVQMRIEINAINMNVIKGRMPDFSELINRQFNCNYRILYEGLIMGVKNVLLEIQKRMKSDDKLLRERLLRREEYTKNVFGERSQQWHDAKVAILRFDDVQLKERAVKFREFLDVNKEKATRAFCRLSKDGGLCDHIGQIKGEDGRAFNTSEERGKYTV
jgi:exonuclease III